MHAATFMRYQHPLNRADYPWPTFSEAEYARRQQLLEHFMDERGLDCLLIAGSNGIWDRCWANLRWVSNYIGTMELDAFCIYPRRGEPTLAILGLNARLPDRIARSIFPDVRGALNTAPLVVQRLKELGLERGRIGVINLSSYFSLSYDHWRALTDTFPEAAFLDYTDEFWRMRMVLSDEEIACLEEAGRLGDLAIQALKEQLRPGMQERDLFAIIYDAIFRNGGEYPCMVLASSESMYASKSGFQRPRPINRTIAVGDVVLTEIGPRDSHGYEAQTGKPITFGPPTPEYQRLFDVCFEAYHRIVEVLRPGCTAADIRAAGQIIFDSGYTVVAPLVHGIFNPIDAGPFVGTAHRPDKDVVLAPNMALVVEIHPCTADLLRGVFLGDTFVITETGARCINQQPPELTVL